MIYVNRFTSLILKQCVQVSVNINWVDSNIEQLIKSYVSRYNEIPDYVGYYSPTVVNGLEVFNDKKIFCDLNPLLSSEFILYTDNIKYEIAKLLEYRLDYNLIVIDELSLEYVAPLVFELQEGRKLDHVYLASPNHILNTVLGKRVEGAFGVNCRSIVNQIEHTQMQGPKSPSIFLLPSSRLGNSINPNKMLLNIYNSMKDGDILILLQGIYNPHNLDRLFNEYNDVLMDDDYAQGDMEIARLIAPEFKMFSTWDDTGFNFKLGIQYFNGDPLFTDRPEGKIDLFRTTRFGEADLIKRIKDINFKIKSINYDYHLNYALFICQK